MYPVLKRTCWAIVLLIRSFVLPRSRCRRRRGLLKCLFPRPEKRASCIIIKLLIRTCSQNIFRRKVRLGTRHFMNHLQKTHNLQSKQCNPHQKRLQQEANNYINYNDQNLWSSWNLPKPNLQFTFSPNLPALMTLSLVLILVLFRAWTWTNSLSSSLQLM